MTLPQWIPEEAWSHYKLSGVYFGFLLILLNDPVTLHVKLIAVASIPIIPLLGLAVLWAKSVLADANASSTGD